MLKEEILSQIRAYLVSKQDGDKTLQVNTRDLERGNLIQSTRLNPGDSLEYIDEIEKEGTISNVKTIDDITLGDAYDNNNKLVTYCVAR